MLNHFIVSLSSLFFKARNFVNNISVLFYNQCLLFFTCERNHWQSDSSVFKFWCICPLCLFVGVSCDLLLKVFLVFLGNFARRNSWRHRLKLCPLREALHMLPPVAWWCYPSGNHFKFNSPLELQF